MGDIKDKPERTQHTETHVILSMPPTLMMGCPIVVRSFVTALNTHLAHVSEKLREGPREGCIATSQMLFYTNMNQQMNDNVHGLPQSQPAKCKDNMDALQACVKWLCGPP